MSVQRFVAEHPQFKSGDEIVPAAQPLHVTIATTQPAGAVASSAAPPQTLAQVAHEILGVDYDRIKVFQGDTLYVPYSTSTWGSRSMVMGAPCDTMRARWAARSRLSTIGI